MPTLARINVTPVKGAALVHPERTELASIGIPGNRRYWLVDDRGKLFSGSSHGPLVAVRAETDGERLRVRFPDREQIEGDGTAVGESIVTNFYGRSVQGHVVEGPFGDAWSAFAGAPVRLVRGDRDGDGPDEMPLTIVSYASVEALASGGGHAGTLDPLRFRINLEIEGCAPYEEDSWDGRRVRIGEAVVRIQGQIPRCVVTTQDPASGRKDWDTLKQIAAQRDQIPGGGLPFGMYAVVETQGAVEVGVNVEPLS
ncbi:MAG: MOSC domain-containing protein [Actinomycetota bacterium]